MVGCWGIENTVHVLRRCFQDAFNVLMYSEAHLALCPVIKTHAKLVVHATSIDSQW